MAQLSLSKLNVFLADNFFYIVMAFAVIFLIMLITIISMKMDLSKMQQRYKKMMGESEGQDLERMLDDNAENMKKVLSLVKGMDEEISAVKDLLSKAITRVAILRYDAFEDISSELSFSIALLDDKNNGVVISALNGRDSSCTYAKPIENGTSKYKLSGEEEQVLREAVGNIRRR